jgi:hypothetical protein
MATLGPITPPSFALRPDKIGAKPANVHRSPDAIEFKQNAALLGPKGEAFRTPSFSDFLSHVFEHQDDMSEKLLN